MTGQPGANSWFGTQGLQPLQSLQVALQQLLQVEFAQQQQLQHLLQVVPLQLHQIQQLIQFVAQHAYQQQSYQQPQLHNPQSFFTGGFPVQSFGGQSGWLGASQSNQPQIFGGQGGFGGPTGYVM